MEPPGITRHRRPFLAPLWVTLLAAAGGGRVVAWAFYRDASTTVVILVHPAEKTPGTIDDPPLSPEGEERAQRLAQMFAGPAVGSIDAIYASDDRRAQQTAAPLAERLHRVPAVLSPPRRAPRGTRVARARRGHRADDRERSGAVAGAERAGRRRAARVRRTTPTSLTSSAFRVSATRTWCVCGCERGLTACARAACCRRRSARWRGG